MNDEEIKVSELDLADEIRDTDQIMIVQGGANKKVTGEMINDRTISNSYGNEEKIGYSQKYLNDKIVNIGATNVSNTPVWFKQGKNLLNITSPIGSTADTFEILADDWMHYVNSSGTSERVVFSKISVKPNTKYSIFVETKDVTGAYFVILETYNNNTRIDTTYPNTSRVITTGSNINYLQFAITTSGMSTIGNYKIRIMVTKNTEIDTAYEPYIRKAININGEDEYYTNDYSTAEQVIGTWLGKPLYRKVVDFTISSVWQDVGTFSNVDFFTKIQLVRKTGGNAYPYYQNSDNYCYAYITTTKTKMIVASSSNENGNTGSLIVEYTKTTD